MTLDDDSYFMFSIESCKYKYYYKTITADSVSGYTGLFVPPYDACTRIILLHALNSPAFSTLYSQYHNNNTNSKHSLIFIDVTVSNVELLAQLG